MGEPAPSGEHTVSQFLREHELFELLPTHGKVVTLDADLPMKHALDALASHSASCLPVWDSHQQRFVDVFTCSDLVDIVLFTHRALAAGAAGASEAGPDGSSQGEAQQAIERCQLRDLHGLKRSKPSGFVMASVDDSMYHGCLMLKQHQLECLPLGDAACSSSLLHLLLPEQVLAFVTTSPDFRQGAHLFGATLAQAVLPHCAALRTINRSTSLADALLLLSEGLLHALPVLDDGGALVDVISCRDVRHLASQSQTGDLSLSVEESLRTLQPAGQRLHTCAPTDSLLATLPRLANAETAQLVCVDERGAVSGVVTSMAILTGLLTSSAPAPAGA